MKKSELKSLIKEVIQESQDGAEFSKKALEVILFLWENDSKFEDESEKQSARRTRGALVSFLTDEDYKKLYPGSNIGKAGGGDREDFARGT